MNVAVIQQDSQTSIAITDTGIGSPSDQRTFIFEPFYRIDQSRFRQMGGAGLGLAMVESVIEKHCGAIQANDNPRGGSVFSYTTPIESK